MSSNVELPVKFMKMICEPRGLLDDMKLPPKFLNGYRDLVPSVVTLNLRKKEKLPVKFLKDHGVLSGMTALFNKFGLENIAILVFEYNGGNSFSVNVLDPISKEELGAELGKDLPYKFSTIVVRSSSSFYNMEIPLKFRDLLQARVTYHLNGWRLIEGNFDRKTCKISGLQQVFYLTSLKLHDVLLFSYTGGNNLYVYAFNQYCMQKSLKPAYLENGLNYDFFEIVIQPSHLQQYSMGVNVPRKFHSIISKWNHLDKIDVSHDSRSWEITIKKRGEKAELHHGWPVLWTQLGLDHGDICVFERAESYFHYSLEVYKK